MLRSSPADIYQNCYSLLFQDFIYLFSLRTSKRTLKACPHPLAAVKICVQPRSLTRLSREARPKPMRSTYNDTLLKAVTDGGGLSGGRSFVLHYLSSERYQAGGHGKPERSSERCCGGCGDGDVAAAEGCQKVYREISY